MARRRLPEPDAAGIPEWVRSFVEAEWVDEQQPPPWWDDSAESWRYFHARRRWSHACRQWGTDHPGIDLFALHYPETAANLAAARRGWTGLDRPENGA